MNRPIFFDGSASFGHAALGAVAAIFPAVSIPLALGYTLYQLRTPDPVANMLGDFAEFATGFVGGRMLKGGR